MLNGWMTVQDPKAAERRLFFFALSICPVLILQSHIFIVLVDGEEEERRGLSNCVDSFHWDRPICSS